MTLVTFLDAAYALQVRESVRLGIPLLDVLDRLESQARRTPEPETVDPQEAAVARQNQRSMAALQGMLGGVKRG